VGAEDLHVAKSLCLDASTRRWTLPSKLLWLERTILLYYHRRYSYTCWNRRALVYYWLSAIEKGWGCSFCLAKPAFCGYECDPTTPHERISIHTHIGFRRQKLQLAGPRDFVASVIPIHVGPSSEGWLASSSTTALGLAQYLSTKSLSMIESRSKCFNR